MELNIQETGIPLSKCQCNAMAILQQYKPIGPHCKLLFGKEVARNQTNSEIGPHCKLLFGKEVARNHRSPMVLPLQCEGTDFFLWES